MRAFIPIAVSVIFVSSCSMASKKSLENRGIDFVEKAKLGDSPENIIRTLGVADRASVSDGNLLTWTYKTSIEGYGELPRVQLIFGPPPRELKSKIIHLFPEDKLASIVEARIFFQDMSFIEYDKAWCDWMPSGPITRFYNSPENGVLLSYSKVHSSISTISWTSEKKRRPADAQSLQSCERPKTAKSTEVSPKNISI